MTALLAELWTDRGAKESRRAVRRRIRLDVPTVASGALRVLVHDLSETGLMIETAADLAVGEELQIDLPEAGPTGARIIWNRDRFFGCEFLSPVSKAAVSAALLRTPIQETSSEGDRWGPMVQPKLGERVEQEEESSATQIVATVGLVLLLAVAILFIFVLLRLPISVDQNFPFSTAK